MRKNISIQSDLNLNIFKNQSEDTGSINIGSPRAILNNNRYQWLFTKHKGSIIRIFGKIFYYFLHLSLIALFETLFYFLYVSKQEDDAIDKNILYITNSISDNCIYLPIEMQKEIVDFLSTQNNTWYLLAKNERFLHNQDLYSYAMGYVYGFIIFTIVIGAILCWVHGGRLKWKSMIFDTIMMMAILTVFEYNFFMNIIRNYLPITPAELEYSIEQQLLTDCNSNIDL
jgi:hypothetical protein